MNSSLWFDAASGLDQEVKSQILKTLNEPCGPGDLLASVKAGQQRCLENRWTLYTKPNGHKIYFRDIFSNVTKWLQAIKDVGDVAVQYDPTAASLPWAAVRLLLTMAISDVHKFGAMFESVVVITNVITRYDLVERLYYQTGIDKREDADRELFSSLRKAIVDLYIAILKHLQKSNKYFHQNKAKRIALSAAQLVNNTVQDLVKDIFEKDAVAQKWLHLVSTKQTQSINTHVENLRLESKQSVEKISEVLSSLEPIGEMKAKIDVIHERIEVDQQRQILEWISNQPYISHHKDVVSSRLEESGLWLTQKTQYRQWSEAFQPSTFWLHGDPGSGKTVLVSCVIDKVKAEQNEDPQAPSLAYFYCKRDSSDPKRSESAEILLSILRQLARPTQHGHIHPAIIDKWQERQDSLSNHKLSHDECMELLQEVTCYGETIIIIDALDECRSDQRHILLDALDNLGDSAQGILKIFVSSRRETDINDSFGNSLNLEIESKDNLEDITRFVNVELDKRVRKKRLLRGKVSSALQTEIKDCLLRDANGMFRWVSASLQTLCNPHTMRLENDVRKALGRLPQELDKVYTIIIQDIKDMGDTSSAIARMALRWLLCAKQPLSSDEFVAVLNAGSDTPIDQDDVLHICCNLVRLDTAVDSFHFMHLSVREFLENHTDYQEDICNAAIANSCLEICLYGKQPKRRLELFKMQKKLLYDYAQIYWPFHCELAGDNRGEGELGKSFRAFMCSGRRATQEFLDWKQRWKDSWAALNLSRKRPDENEIYEKLQDCLDTACTACVFGFPEVIQDRKRAGKDDGSTDGGSSRDYLATAMAYGQHNIVLQLQSTTSLNKLNTRRMRLRTVAAKGDVQTVAEMLRQDTALSVTEEIIEDAAASNDVPMVKYLLDGFTAGQVTENMLIAAAKNSKHGHMVTEFLVERWPRDGTPFPDWALEQACLNSKYGLEIIEALLSARDQVAITTELIRYAVANETSNFELLKRLLRNQSELKVDEEMLEDAAASKTAAPLELLLTYDANHAISQHVVYCACCNEECADVIVPLLLEHCDPAVITDDALIAAMYNRQYGLDIVRTLLSKISIPITTRVLGYVARSPFLGESILKFLLSLHPELELDTNFLITAVRNDICGQELTRITLDFNRKVVIVDAVLSAAASNRTWGLEILEILLEHSPNSRVGSDVVFQAAGNPECGFEIMRFLSRRPGRLAVTAEAIEEAADNSRCGDKIFDLWLRENLNLEISEVAVEKAAENTILGTKILQLMINCSSSIPISSNAICMAAANEYCGDKILRMFLDHEGSLQLSELAFVECVTNQECGVEILKLFLEQPDITQTIFNSIDEVLRYNNTNKDALEILMAKAKELGFVPNPRTIEHEVSAMREGGKILERLLQENPGVEITSIAIEEGISESDDPIKTLNLFRHYKPDLKITDLILCAAIKNKLSTRSTILYFIDYTKENHNMPSITDEILECVLDRGTSDDKAILALLLQEKLSQDGDQNLSERVVAMATKCTRPSIYLDFLAQEARNRDVSLPLTKKVYLAAATNNGAMRHLSKMDTTHFGDFSLDEEVLLAVTCDTRSGYRILKLFSDVVAGWREKVIITPQMLGEAQGSILGFLLQILRNQGRDVLSDNFITEETLKRSARGRIWDLRMLWAKMPSGQKDADMTLRILQEAIFWCNSGEEWALFNWIWFISQAPKLESVRQALLTEETIICAISNEQGAATRLIGRLEEMAATIGIEPPQIPITERILLAATAAGNYNTINYVLRTKPGHVDRARYLQSAYLRSAVNSRNSAEVRYRLQRKALPDIKDMLGFTALAQAALFNYWSVAATLLECCDQIDINSTSLAIYLGWEWGSCSGQTPLHWAASSGNSWLVKRLLEKGADASIKNDKGRTAEDFAVEEGHDSTVKILRNWCGVPNEKQYPTPTSHFLSEENQLNQVHMIAKRETW